MSTHTGTIPDVCRADQAYLAALVTSVACARLFVRQVCSYWQLDQERIDIAELLVSELASNAVQASGVTELQSVKEPIYAELKLIGVRLLELHDSLVIEVWDTSPQPPMLLQPDEALEHGRGLQIVDALSIRWGHYDARIGGKIVWCQLALNDTADANGPDDAATFQQIQKALQAHQWDEQA
jgi:anti-sigma regulatory factor (Ser/Thr protein kinase)